MVQIVNFQEEICGKEGHFYCQKKKKQIVL